MKSPNHPASITFFFENHNDAYEVYGLLYDDYSDVISSQSQIEMSSLVRIDPMSKTVIINYLGIVKTVQYITTSFTLLVRYDNDEIKKATTTREIDNLITQFDTAASLVVEPISYIRKDMESKFLYTMENPADYIPDCIVLHGLELLDYTASPENMIKAKKVYAENGSLGLLSKVENKEISIEINLVMEIMIHIYNDGNMVFESSIINYNNDEKVLLLSPKKITLHSSIPYYELFIDESFTRRDKQLELLG